MRWLPLLTTAALVIFFVGVIAFKEAKIASRQLDSSGGNAVSTEDLPFDQADVAGVESESEGEEVNAASSVTTQTSASASIDIDVDVSSDGEGAPQANLEMTTDEGVQTLTCDPGERYRSEDGSLRCSNRNGDLNLRFSSRENTKVIRIKFSTSN